MLRFTIRDLLWLMVVVGLACVLLVQQHKLQAVRSFAKQLSFQLSLGQMAAEGFRDRTGGNPPMVKIEDVNWSLADDPIP
ncbi:MAG TPA: hypothetical protein VGI40_17945 [Pirellulaceae bacterium]|jgi:hypothetical protein